MVNAVPVILGNLVRIHNLTCPNVSAYANKRADILEETGWDKHKVIKMIFWHKEPKNAPDFFKKMHSEIYNKLVPVLKVVYDRQYELVEKTKRDNINGKFLSHVAFIQRNIISKSAFDFYIEKNLSPDVLMFDGIMLKIDKSIDQD